MAGRWVYLCSPTVHSRQFSNLVRRPKEIFVRAVRGRISFLFSVVATSHPIRESKICWMFALIT